MNDLLIGGFAGVDPLVVDVDGLGQEVDGGLEILQADVASHFAGVPRFLHLHFAGLFVVAKRAVEQRVQRLDGLPFGPWTTF